MKKVLVLLLSSVLLVSSCGIVSVSPNASSNPTSSIHLEEEKKVYIDKLRDHFKYDDYFEDTWHDLDVAIQECVNRINECDDDSKLEDIYNDCIDYVNKTVPNIDNYRNEIINLVKIDELLNLYFASEQEIVEQRFNAFKANISMLQSKKEIATALNSFLNSIKNIKSKQNYISEYIEKIKEYQANIFESEYYDEQLEEINKLISDYHADLNLAEVISDLDDAYDAVVEAINSVKKKSAIDQERINNAISQCVAELRSLGISESELEVIEQDMIENSKCVEDVLLKYVTARIDYVSSLIIDEDEKLALFKELRLQALQYIYLRKDKYFANEQQSIDETLEQYISELNLVTSIEALNNKYNDALSDLDVIDDASKIVQDEIDDFSNSVSTLTSGKSLTAFTKTKASDYYEFAEIIDSYLFYQLEDYSFLKNQFKIKVSFPYHNLFQLRNDVYWYCRLVRCAADINFTYDTGYIVVTLTNYEQASQNDWDLNTKVTKLNDIVAHKSDSVTTDRDNDFESFPYLGEGRPELFVWNSQQLWYAFEKNYCPVVKSGSKAEIVMDRAKDILRSIIKEGMNEKDKIYAIYKWLGENVQFDNGVYKYNYSTDMDNYPAQNLASYNSFYIEGPLIDGLAVCSGYAKAYLLLLSIEGIECVNDIAKPKAYENISTINTSTGGIGNHEFTFVKLDGHWFYSDSERSSLEYDSRMASWANILLPLDYEVYGKRIYNKDFENYPEYASYMLNDLNINDKKIFVENYEEMKELIDNLPELNENEKFSVIFSSTYKNAKNDFYNLCSKYDCKEYDNGGLIHEMIAYK